MLQEWYSTSSLFEDDVGLTGIASSVIFIDIVLAVSLMTENSLKILF